MGKKSHYKKRAITPKEWEFLELKAKGLKDLEIAQELSISINAIESRRNSVFMKITTIDEKWSHDRWIIEAKKLLEQRIEQK